jgi:hypothetical protein
MASELRHSSNTTGAWRMSFHKMEDAGEGLWDADIIPPDYRLILNDGTIFLLRLKLQPS